jgi:hypothetical protein
MEIDSVDTLLLDVLGETTDGPALLGVGPMQAVVTDCGFQWEPSSCRI